MNRKELLLKTALKLFASNGYDGTSTKEIALTAQVSEGLIFRHFKNKEGLLASIIEYGTSISSKYITPILALSDPIEVICAAVQLPGNVPVDDHEFWKLLYTLKWQQSNYSQNAFAPLKEKLIWAFQSLNYSDPEAEAQLIEIYIDGLATEILLRNGHPEKLTQLILSKYKTNGNR